MKKRLILTSFLLCLITAACYDEDIAKLTERVDALESIQIATLKEQVENIKNTLPQLEKADEELGNYINNLQETAASLQDELEATECEIAEVEAHLTMAIEELRYSIEAPNEELLNLLQTTQADILARLEAAKADMENELAQINTTIELLQAKDEALEKRIEELETYITKSGIEDNKNWAEATFATLEQYNSLATEIATIKENITAISNSITALDKKFSATIQSEIDKTLDEVNSLIQDLDAEFSGTIKSEIEIVTKYINEEIATVTSKITSALAEAIAEAKDEITNEYTSAISSAIADIETSMKSWVNQQLAGYYTMEQTDAKLQAIKLELESQMASQKVYLESLIINLSDELNKQIERNSSLVESLQKSIAQLEQTDAELAELIADNSSRIIQNAETIASNTGDIRNNVAEIDSIKAIIESLRTPLEGDCNEKIKELEEALDKKIAENNKLIEANNLKISANSTAIDENNKAIETLMNSTNEAIGNNAMKIAENTENIAKNAAAIAHNAATLNSHAKAIAQNMLDIIDLQQALEDTKVEIALAVASSIEEAIANSEDKLTNYSDERFLELEHMIYAYRNEMEMDIAKLSSYIDYIYEQLMTKSRLALYDFSDMPDQIEAIINRIQSVTFVPEYSDGKATMFYTNSSGVITAGDATLKYEIRPASVATELASAWETALKAKAVYTKTRAASDFVSLDIKSATANEGILEVVVSGANFCEEFFRNEISASICLEISSGYNCLTSGYTQIIPWETGAVDIP